MKSDSERDFNRRGLCLAGLGADAAFVALDATSSGAEAAECPADRNVTSSNLNGPTQPRGVADAVLTTIDLAGERAALRGYQLRLRRLIIQPGGDGLCQSGGDA